MNYMTFAPHADRDIAPDKISVASREAKQAVLKYGEDEVINSTLGECQDDQGNLMVLPTVERLIREAPVTDICAYAPMGGISGFNEAVQISLFGKLEKRWYVEAVPTPGGCGALRHIIWNFLEDGERVLTTDYHWGPYKGICEEHNRQFCTFPMLNDGKSFYVEALEREARRILDLQPRLLLILNTPANNPTGYSMTKQEMERVMDVLRNLAQDVSKKITLCLDVSSQDVSKKITLCLDVSYIDFAGSFEESRAIFDTIRNIPPNMMVTLVFSMSKSYTMCGMRCGAVVCLSPEKEASLRFKQIMSVSSRTTWSNVIRLSQKVLVEICSNPKLLKQTNEERETFKKIIRERAKIFLNAAKEAGITCCHYDHGYFITILCKYPELLAKKLCEYRVYVVPMQMGIRFSPCAVSGEKCKRAPELIKRALREVEVSEENT